MKTPAPPPRLIEIIARQCAQTPDPALEVLRDSLQARYGDALQAILYYGSCLRGGNPFDGLVDLYVIVDDYRGAYPGRRMALLNALLPPNVFYMEEKLPQGTLRTKYAVLSRRDLDRGCSRWFHSYVWARFAQPTGLLYARDQATEDEIHTRLAQAVMTFMARVLPRLPATFTAADLWERGLGLTYRAELRVEKGQRSREIYRHYQTCFEDITACALASFPEIRQSREGGSTTFHQQPQDRISDLANRAGWRLRIIQGKFLSVARLLKAFFTFEGGLDYLIWKLERHSGTTIEVSPRVRRYPLIFIWGLMWRLYRQGVFR